MNYELSEVIILQKPTTVKPYVANLLKKDKILQIRKRNSAISHEYYAMANKYKDYEKCMITFTIPDKCIKAHNGIKNGRYSKMRTLVAIKSDLAKLLSRESDIKYFINIEMGEKFSNPHIHLQLWCKNNDNKTTTNVTSSTIANIKNKIITKHNLITKRCPTTLPDRDIDVFHYIVKDYSKHLTDDEVWNLDVQKKRYRKQYGKVIRFYSKSGDKYNKSTYRWCYRLGILRNIANEWLDFFIENFLVFNKKNLPKISCFGFSFGELCLYITRGFERWYWFVFILFEVETAARDPPFKFYLK